jgi:hypothetical protein
MRTGLCVIFNHPFKEQIPLLRELYGGRFEKLLFLHPLDRTTSASDVHVTYGGSFTFDAMIVGARDRILHAFSDCDIVLFAHNDLLLNPEISGGTFASQYGIDAGTILTPGIGHLSGDMLNRWPWGFRGAMNWMTQRFLFAGGAEAAKSFLPSRDEAQARARALGLSDTTVLLPAAESELAKLPPEFRTVHESIFTRRAADGSPEPVDLGYPLFTGYSDFFAVPVGLLAEWFGHLGPLSAMLIFAEVAIPTAHVLTAKRMISLRDLGRAGQMLWGNERGTIDDIKWVADRFSQGDVFIHPMKYNTFSDAYLMQLKAMYSGRP